MLAAERHRTILTHARRQGNVRTSELAKEFGVAEETIRRDLDMLAKKGQLARTHGGALDPSASLTELPQFERESLEETEKTIIAKKAANLIGQGETILLDASSTALKLASHLPDHIRVVTYSMAVTERLVNRPDLELVVLGGSYESKGRRFGGMITERALLSLRIDRFFFSGRGYDHRLGISEPNPEQARLKSMMLKHAAWACALIDHTKLGLRSDYFFAKTDEFVTLVTDPGAKSFFSKPEHKPSFQLII